MTNIEKQRGISNSPTQTPAEFSENVGRMMETVGEYMDYKDNEEIKKQRRGTMGAILGFLGVTGTTISTITINIIRKKYSFSGVVKAWRKEGIKGVRKYMVSPNELVGERESKDKQLDRTEEERGSRGATEKLSEATLEEQEGQEELETSTEKEKGSEEIEKGYENMSEKELMAEFMNTSSMLRSLTRSHEDLLMQMNSETVDKMTGPDYMKFVNRNIALHNATVYALKETLNNDSERINRLFEAIYKKTNENVMVIGPFASIIYDKDRKTVSIKYATTSELRNIYYNGVDMALTDKWTEEILRISPGILTTVAGTGLYMAPILGTGLDIKDMVKHLWRRSYRDAGYSALFAGLGLVCDVPIALGIVAKLTGVGIPAGAAGVGLGAKGRIALSTKRGARVAKRTRKAIKAGKAVKSGHRIKDSQRALSAIGQMGKAAQPIKSNIGAIRGFLKSKRAYMSMGVGMGSGLMKTKGITPSGGFEIGQEIVYETANDGNLPPLSFERLDIEGDSEEKEFNSKIKNLKSQTGWSHIGHEYLGEGRIRIYRDDSDKEGLVIIRKAQNIDELDMPNFEGMRGMPQKFTTWRIEGMGKEYLDIYQAVTMANLLNNMDDIMGPEDFDAKRENPFIFTRSGDMKMEGNLSDEQSTVLGASDAWTMFYYNQLNMNIEDIQKTFNEWYGIKSKK